MQITWLIWYYLIPISHSAISQSQSLSQSQSQIQVHIRRVPLTCSFSCCRLWGKLKLLGQGVSQTATNKSCCLPTASCSWFPFSPISQGSQSASQNGNRNQSERGSKSIFFYTAPWVREYWHLDSFMSTCDPCLCPLLPLRIAICAAVRHLSAL